MKPHSRKKRLLKKKARRAAPHRSKAQSPRRSRSPKLQDEPASVDMQSILSEVRGASDQKRLEHWEQIECPYCGEGFEVHIDAAEDGQTLYQDCHVCCKPISMFVQVEDEDVHISVARA